MTLMAFTLRLIHPWLNDIMSELLLVATPTFPRDDTAVFYNHLLDELAFACGSLVSGQTANRLHA